MTAPTVPASPTPDPRLLVTTEVVPGQPTVLVLGGRLDAVEALRVRERLAHPDLARAEQLVIDLTDVTFIDSAGLAALARARRDRVLEGGSVVLVRPRSEEAMRVFRLTQFDLVFTILDSRGGEPAP